MAGNTFFELFLFSFNVHCICSLLVNTQITLQSIDCILQLRVSSEISNGAVILNVDCDMYSYNSETVKDALCFFMDEEKGHEIAYVQLPQLFNNITKNDIYGSSLALGFKVGGINNIS